VSRKFETVAAISVGPSKLGISISVTHGSLHCLGVESYMRQKKPTYVSPDINDPKIMRACFAPAACALNQPS
jgi:hypothetical protein